MNKHTFIPNAAIALALFTTPQSHAAPSTEEARSIAKDAYLYAFAMLENYNTWYPQAVVKESPTYVGGFNVFRHYAQTFTPDNKDVVTPNNDTPYSWAWLDLRAEPMVVSVPEVPADRYYVLQCVDLFSYNFAYIGSRSTGNGAANFLITGPQWKGEIPDGFKNVFKSETEIVGILGRTQLNGPDDVESVKKVQAGYKLTPLSKFLGKSAPPPAPALDFPPYDKAKAATHEFIPYLNFLLSLAEPPHPKEVAIRKRFEAIGIIPGATWEPGKLGTGVVTAIDEGVKDAQAELKKRIDSTHSSNGLFGSRETLGEDYLKRDTAAAMGLYGNDLEEAWYGGAVGDGTKPLKIHFAPGQLPPAKFFWSITAYTLPDRFLYANPLHRYSMGDRTQGMKKDADGGLTIYLGNKSPGTDRESNWLPVPAGPYSFVARVYGPSEAAIKGEWKLPALEPAE
ncbi:MAG: DUF1254 domain-containing protein [Luteolibacter sp.]